MPLLRCPRCSRLRVVDAAVVAPGAAPAPLCPDCGLALVPDPGRPTIPAPAPGPPFESRDPASPGPSAPAPLQPVVAPPPVAPLAPIRDLPPATLLAPRADPASAASVLPTAPTLIVDSSPAQRPTVFSTPATGAVAAPVSAAEPQPSPTAPTVRAAPGASLSDPSLPAAGALARPESEGETFGRYRLSRELGRGGMGVVYKAWDTDLRRFVALKTLLPEAAPGPEQVERFLREARAAGGLRHPNIVQVHDVGDHAGRHYFTMDFIEGRSLDAAKVDLPPRRFLEIVRDVALALDAAHRAGVIHRDVKPANILLDAAGRPYVSDFGLAKEVKEAAGRGGTVSGTIMGTPHYMSPEQAQGRLSRIGPKSDAWSLGVMLYEHLAGAMPFDGATYMEILLAIVQKDPVPPSIVAATRAASAAKDAALHASAGGPRRRIHRDLETLCLKCLEKEPDRRYASAEALAADLGRFLEGEPIEARPPTMTYRAQKWVARRRAVVVAVGLGLTGVALAGGVAWRARASARERDAAARESARANEALQQRLVRDFREKAGLYLEVILAARNSGLSLGRARTVYLPRVVRAVREVEAQAQDWAEPYWQLGRIYRALLDFRNAAIEQDKALAEQPDFAPSLYERVVLTSVRCQDRERRLRQEWLLGRALRAAQAKLAQVGQSPENEGQEEALRERLARDPELSKLRSAVRADVVKLEAIVRGEEGARPQDLERAGGESITPQLLSVFARCARGLELFLTGTAADRGKAGELLLQVAKEEPGFEEVYEPLAENSRSYEDRIEVFSRALEVDAGYSRFWLGRGIARLRQAQRQEYLRQEPTANFEGALSDLTRAVDLAPSAEARAEALLRRAAVRREWGDRRRAHGQEPLGDYQEALADASKALELAPAENGGWLERGLLGVTWGDARRVIGEDPVPYYKGALADFAEAIKLAGPTPDLLLCRGSLLRTWAFHEAYRGGEAAALYESALADCAKVVELEPGRDAWMARGYTLYLFGLHRAQKKQEPGETWKAALADFDLTLARMPDYAYGHVRRAETLQALGRYEEALREYEETARLDPRLEAGLKPHLQDCRARLEAAGLDGLQAALRLLQAADRSRAGARYAKARPQYEDGFKRVEAALAALPAEERARVLSLEAEDGLRAKLRAHHYHYAEVLAQAVVGKAFVIDGVHPVVPEEAARRRDATFAHLDQALELGLQDADALAANPHFEPVRGDARWSELLGRMK
ncbi:MAG: protein kinase [Planctomycetes bacterium]|nr:protein kinase [Planctomycetota bacterium]